jgi:hypothetical protein
MRILQQYILVVFLLAGLLQAKSAFPQDPVKKEPLKHKFMWLRFGMKRHPDAFNPNVKHGKSTHEQSRKEARENAKAIRRAKKEYKKSIKKSARARKRGHA